MYSSLIAVVLCIVTQAAAAQRVAPVPVVQHAAEHARAGADLIKKQSVVIAPPVSAHSGGGLINTAAAGTHDEMPVLTHRAPAHHAGAQDEQHRRGGPAMLLAALALMSGIALRRFGAHKE